MAWPLVLHADRRRGRQFSFRVVLASAALPLALLWASDASAGTAIVVTKDFTYIYDNFEEEALELIGDVAVKLGDLLATGLQDPNYPNPALFRVDYVAPEPAEPTFNLTNLIPPGGGGSTTDAPPPDALGKGFNISRDGDSVVGYVDNGPFTTFHAFRWTETTGIVDLGTLDPPNNATKGSFAYDVSSDGAVITGYSSTAGVKEHVYRWTEATGMVDLDAVNPESHQSQGYSMSADGNVIVGQRDLRAFRWTQGGGFQGLGSTAYFANAVNGDGTVVVGQLTPGEGFGAFRWTESGGLQNLGTLPGDTVAMATAVSDDGNVIVGISSTGFVGRGSTGNQIAFDVAGARAFYWTPAGGMQDLTQLLADAGADMTDVTMVAATGISPDGEWIGGAVLTPDIEEGETAAIFASLTATPPDANFNELGGVDGADLANWRLGFGTTGTATHMQGDANGDDDADGGDFLIWQRQFGASVPARRC